MAGDRPVSDDARVQRVVQFFENLSLPRLDALHEIYAAEARFIDPFNDANGLDAIRRVYAHMYEQLEQPRFRIQLAALEQDAALVLWTFSFRRRGRAQTERIDGTSELRFGADGRLLLHRDHWDPQPVYDMVPLLGAALRWLRRRLSAR
ncbi:nuclear transport factor 2 family protein [Caldimonas sp. KR1-144]|uniref:nuclear transport factor 2 family protein n=1 Tax=Caldimonas sp. KR1-144 TaxID=3400911 RepID=UPI003C0794F0